MKKTLIALAVTALSTSAFAGVSIYEQDGTSVSLDGRVHVRAEKTTSKTGSASTVTNSALKNDGSRFAFNVKHNLSDAAYALGRLEIRFDSGATGKDNWGDAYAKRAFVGLGHKQFGQVTFGKQLLIGDDIGRIGLDNAYGVGSGLASAGGWAVLNEAADSSVRYDYTAVEGLKLSADYEFATARNTGSAEKNGYGLGGIYEFKAGEGTASVSLGYAHKDFENTIANTLKDQNGVYGGFNYVINGLKFGVDGGHSVRSHNNSDKDKLNFIRAGLRYDIADINTGVYGNYGYLTVKDVDGDKNTAHRTMLGVDYKFHKNVKVYLEGRLDKIRLWDSTRKTESAVGTGLIVFW